MYITNNPDIASIAEQSGTDRIFVDLETIGKQERQRGMNTVQSQHSISDIKIIRKILTKAQLLVRSNPIHGNSGEEIERIIDNGAEMIMLPYFKTADEVKRFLSLVNGRTKTCLLVETKEAVENIDEILALYGIDEVYIGLNDLHLSYKKQFMFELLADGTVDYLSSKFKLKGVPFGFGGIAKLHQGLVPGEMIMKEHYRTGSSCVILSRSFCNTELVVDYSELEKDFSKSLYEIRELEKEIQQRQDDFQYFENNRRAVVDKVNRIVNG